MKLFSYVVEHDTGHAPNPFFGHCTLCRCKYRKSPDKPRNVVELAKKGDWVAGTGGADQRRSAGHGKLVYAMHVDKILTRKRYWHNPRFKKKRRVKGGTYEQTQGDNIRPRGSFEKHKQFVLISRHFYYFGEHGIDIPKKKFPDLEKKGAGFRRDFAREYIKRFVTWLEERGESGKLGEPGMREDRESSWEGSGVCKSSCSESA